MINCGLLSMFIPHHLGCYILVCLSRILRFYCQDIEGLARLTKDYSSVVPGSMSRIQKLFTRSAAATEPARAAVIYGSSGDWPRLSLVERVCVGNRAKEEEGPWTKIGNEVNSMEQTKHIPSKLM